MADTVPGTGLTKMDLVKQAAESSLRLFTAESNIGVWEFTTNLDGPRDWRQRVPIGPISALAAYQYVKQHYEPDRLNLVVLYPNGRNNDLGGGLTLSQLLERLREGQRDDRKVRILTFAHGADADLAVLKQISDATGGVLFASPNPADIDRVFVTAVANFLSHGGPPCGGAATPEAIRRVR